MIDINDYDNEANYEVLGSDFILMINAVNTYYIDHKKADPTIVFLRKNKMRLPQYITYARFKQMRLRWNNYVTLHKRNPLYVYINEPSTINKPAWYLTLEKNLGVTINHMDDLYNGVVSTYQRLGSIYLHISCLQGATVQTEASNANIPYNNCARWAQLGMAVAQVLGVQGSVEYGHVDCDYASGQPDPYAGHYILLTDDVKFDLAHAASSGGALGTTMCINGFNGYIDHNAPCP